MIFRVLDIETIPDPSVWAPGEDKYEMVPCLPEPHVPIKNSKLDGAIRVTSGEPRGFVMHKIEPFPRRRRTGWWRWPGWTSSWI